MTECTRSNLGHIQQINNANKREEKAKCVLCKKKPTYRTIS